MKVKRVTFANKLNEVGFSGQSYEPSALLDIDYVEGDGGWFVKLTPLNRPEELPTLVPLSFVAALKLLPVEEPAPVVEEPAPVVEDKPTPAPKAKTKAA